MNNSWQNLTLLSGTRSWNRYFKWTGSDTIGSASRGPSFDARKLATNNNNSLYSIFKQWWTEVYFNNLKDGITALCNQICNTSSKAACKDPLILDLDGDGVETTNVKDGAYFDHDGNGFAEQTGWASSDDGLLVMDRNSGGIINDGKELFGGQNLIKMYL